MLQQVQGGEFYLSAEIQEELLKYDFGPFRERCIPEYFAMSQIWRDAHDAFEQDTIWKNLPAGAQMLSVNGDMVGTFDQTHSVNFDTALRIYDAFADIDRAFYEESILKHITLMRVLGPRANNLYDWNDRDISFQGIEDGFWNQFREDALSIDAQDGWNLFDLVRQTIVHQRYPFVDDEGERNFLPIFHTMQAVMYALSNLHNDQCREYIENEFGLPYEAVLELGAKLVLHGMPVNMENQKADVLVRQLVRDSDDSQKLEIASRSPNLLIQLRNEQLLLALGSIKGEMRYFYREIDYLQKTGQFQLQLGSNQFAYSTIMKMYISGYSYGQIQQKLQELDGTVIQENELDEIVHDSVAQGVIDYEYAHFARRSEEHMGPLRKIAKHFRYLFGLKDPSEVSSLPLNTVEQSCPDLLRAIIPVMREVDITVHDLIFT